MGYFYKVFYTKHDKKKSIIIRASSRNAAANLALRQLTNSFDDLAEIEVYYVKCLVK